MHGEIHQDVLVEFNGQNYKFLMLDLLLLLEGKQYINKTTLIDRNKSF